ncbi:MAG: hypothetical protein K0R50_1384 [Eubacterium sp.]|jgi:hypothetical protein|nr:hypothetical protein [Eubacterium sp.]
MCYRRLSLIILGQVVILFPINKAHISYGDYIRILLDENLDSESAGVLQEILVADKSYTY